MQSKIRELINQCSYNDALAIIGQELTKKFDLQNENDERWYTELLALQTTARTLLGGYDNIILDAVRKEKFPSEVRYSVTPNKHIKLRFQNSFFLSCNAYVNVIHNKNYFEFSSQSASDSFLKRIGKDKIYAQFKHNRKYKTGEVITINHPDLVTPMSFHLVAYHDNIKIDMKVLDEGIKKIFKSCVERKFTQISCFALGYDAINAAPEDKRDELAEELADHVARSVLHAMQTIPKEVEFTVFFNFIKTDSFDVYNRAFYRWTRKDPVFFLHTKQLEINQQKFIDAVKTNNHEFIKTIKKLSRVIEESSSILFQGETGVGKSFIAGLAHKFSKYSKGPFESFNCALLKEGKNYTQLFGWIKGSYTDAREDGIGLIEKAEGGTLFLDEVGNLGNEAQKALLTYLDDGTYRRYGDSKIRNSNVRLIFGTNQDLHVKVRQGIFAQDLYERIAMREFQIPPLRERVEDIRAFIDWLISSLNQERKLNIKISDEALLELEKFSWPGNVRQLQFYVQNLYNDCIYDNVTNINRDMILESPPRNELYEQNNSLTDLRKALFRFLKCWNADQGKFMEEFLKPLLAKIYKDDLNGNIKETDKFLGISGSSGKNSPFYNAYNKYPQLEDRYNH